MEQNRHYALWLTGIMAGVFALQTLSSYYQIFPQLTSSFLLVSRDVFSRPWILLTSIFLHMNIVHILYNGFALVMFGSILEQFIGSKRFLAVFFATGIFSSIVSTFFYPSVLGASGAIFGVIGALVVLQPKLTVWVYYIPMPMYVAAIVWAASDLFGFIVPTGIANAGHLAGLATGLAAGFILRGRKPLSLTPGGSGKRMNILTAEEFDKWEKDNMGKQ